MRIAFCLARAASALKRSTISLFVIVWCLSAVAALAQTAGSITGEVKDQSGAVAPNAAVTATNSKTNVARSTATNASGIYSFPDLTPGIYEVKVVAAGFATIVKTNIELQVQQTARVDFMLARSTLLIVAGQLSPDDERYVDHSRLRVIYQPFRGERLREQARALATRAALSALGAISRG